MAATAHMPQTQAQKTEAAAAAAAAVVLDLIKSPPIQQVGPGSMHGPLWHLSTFERPLYPTGITYLMQAWCHLTREYISGTCRPG